MGADPAGVVIFDLDGTIADTAADLVPATNAALAEEGLPPADPEAILKSVGYGTRAMLRSALSCIGHAAGDAQLERMARALVAHYEANIAVHTALFPGFAVAGKLLIERGARLALCTNKRERLTLKLLNALGIANMFAAVAGGDTFSFHKPDPRHLTELIERAGGNGSRAIMVGDSETDVAAARAAGIPVIVVSFGYASTPAEDLGADAVLHRFADLPPLLDSFIFSDGAAGRDFKIREG